MSIKVIPAVALLSLLAACGSSGDASKKPSDTEAAKTAEAKPEASKAADTAAASGAGAAPAEPGVPPAPPDVAAPPSDAVSTSSGLATKVLTAGTGTEKPRAWDKVKVHYTGWTTDGKMFDSSLSRGQPTELPLSSVIPGWTEGLQLMTTGEKRRMWIPEKLAYEGRPGRPAGMLVFDVELLEITRMPEPPPVPEDVAAPPASAQKTASGVASRVLAKGKGTERPKADSIVKVHYTGWTNDGHMFDSSISRGEPMTFPIQRASPGWAEGLQLMVVGEKRRFWFAPEAVFGPGNGPDKPVVLDVELLEILKPAEPPKAPSDVAKAPADAKTTASKLAYKVLKKGTGTAHPTAQSTVRVHYTGWTTDGKMFDSSVARGEPAEFPLNGVIAGWTEGLQLMVEGEKTRFWIPEDLAYKGQGSGPQGMLVFEVELLKIVN